MPLISDLVSSISEDYFRGLRNTTKGNKTGDGHLANIINAFVAVLGRFHISSGSTKAVEKFIIQFPGGHAAGTNDDRVMTIPDGAEIRVFNSQVNMRGAGTVGDQFQVLKGANSIYTETAVAAAAEDDILPASQLDQDHVDVVGGTDTLTLRYTDGGDGNCPPIDVMVEFFRTA